MGISDWIDDIDWNIGGLAIIFWGICLLMIWKLFDPTVMRMHIKIIMTIVMLPVCYLLVNMISDK